MADADLAAAPGQRVLAWLLALILLTAPAMAQEGLYDRPTLMLDPGMHTASIRRADVDAAGRFMVTGSHDKTVRVWNAQSGALLRTIAVPRGPGNVGKIFAVAIDPAGELIAAGGLFTPEPGNEFVYLIDRATGAIRQRLDGLPNVVLHLAFSPGAGRFLVATLWGANGIRVYDRAAGWAKVPSDTGYGGDSYGAAFASDGRLATTSYDGTLRLYAPGRYDTPLLSVQAGGRPFGIAFSMEGDRIAVGFQDKPSIALFDAATLALLPAPDTSGISNGDLSEVAFAADGALLAGGIFDRGGPNPVVRWRDGGAGAREEWAAGQTTLMSLLPLAQGDLLVAAADPFLARLDPAGEKRWQQGPALADFRGQERELLISRDGSAIEFGYSYGGEDPAHFTLGRLQVKAGKGDELSPPDQSSLDVANWEDRFNPTLNGTPLPLDRHEMSRSLAIHPDGARFVLGTSWSLRAFDATGTQLWRRATPGTVWAVNISGDGRFAVAAYGDGTIRWHRMEDGGELLAFAPFKDRKSWVAWTPEGYYTYEGDAAQNALRWVVNRGWDKVAEITPVSSIKGFDAHREIPFALSDGGIIAALGRRYDDQVIAEAERVLNADFRQRLHFIGIGVSDYADTSISLKYAAKDVTDIGIVLQNRDDRLYEVREPEIITNGEVTNTAIRRVLNNVKGRVESGNKDVVVILYSGHAAQSGGDTFLLPHNVDRRDIANTGFDLDYFRSLIQRIGEKAKVIVLLDACHSGNILGAKSFAIADVDAIRKTLEGAGTSVMVLTSSKGDELSFEDAEWANGAFTKAVREAFESQVADKNGNGWLTVPELYDHVRGSVVAKTGGKQNPQIGGLTDQLLLDNLFRVGG